MSRVRAVAAVMAWLVLVGGASTLVWAVISRAGGEVVASQQPLAPASGTTLGQPSEDVSPEPTSAATDASTATSSPGSTPSDSPDSSQPPPASPAASPPTTPRGSPPTSSPGPAPQRRTWQGLGGAVVAQCERAVISVISAAPADGFRAEVKNGGPEELEIEFEGREDETGHGATVRARCVSGVPDFRAEVSDD